MNGSEKVFFDTSPFIYLIENHPDFFEKTETFILELATNFASFHTSVLTETEFSIQPIKLGKSELIDDYEQMLVEMEFKVYDIDIPIAKRAAHLRVKYNLKTVDALQVATALEHKCTILLTNDIPLKRVTEINVVVVSEF